jgi:hypothetical protein
MKGKDSNQSNWREQLLETLKTKGAIQNEHCSS